MKKLKQSEQEKAAYIAFLIELGLCPSRPHERKLKDIKELALKHGYTKS